METNRKMCTKWVNDVWLFFQLQDPADQHTFIVVNKLNDDSEKIFLDYLPCFGLPQFQYHVILTCKVNQSAMRKLR